jgi:hypothetical protein
LFANVIRELGKYCRNADPSQREEDEPAEYHSKGSATLNFADASDTDGCEDQGPDCEDVKFRQ